MINILNNILSTVVLVIQSVINTVTSAFTILTHVPTYTSFLYTAIGMLPNSILLFATASVAVYVVMFFINLL